MADQRTMAELLRASTEVYAEAIVAWDCYKDLLRAFPHHGFTELHQLDTFYNALKPADQDSLNSAAGGNLLERRTQDVLTIIENKSEIAKLTRVVNQQTSAVTTAMIAILKQFQATPPPASIKAIEEICVTCDGAHPYYQCLVTDGNTFPEFRDNIQGYVSLAAVNYNQASMSNQTNELKNMITSFFQMNTASTSGLGPLPSNTIANPKGELKAITTRSGVVLDGPFVSMPHPFINLEEEERTEKTLTDPELTEYTIKVPPPLVQKAKPPLLGNYVMLKALLSNKEKLLQLANTPLNENCSLVILKKLPEKLKDPRKFLIPCGFSELMCKALADLSASINLMPLSVWKKLGLPELISTRMNLELANRAICTPAGIARDVFVLVGKFIFPVDFFIVDYESDPRVPLILGRPFLQTARALIDVHEEEMILHNDDERLTLNMRYDTSSYSNQPNKESINMINIYNDSYEDYLKDFGNATSSSPNHLLEEFADELALITFPPRNDDLLFDIESDLREIKYLLNHDPTKEMDSILEDSDDEDNLAEPNKDLVDTNPEMFIDEHTLDYSSLPLYDDVDDDLVELEFDNDDVYDDLFDSKEDKIKECKLLIDELDPPRSSDFLPSLECELVLYEDFSEDFNPPLYELPFHEEVLMSKTLLSFSPEMRKKFSTLRFSLLKEFILLFSRNYLIGALKLSKSLKFLKGRWRFFLTLMERTSVF
nr:reverse transcriptase domain-containing protein [Tanacetum cinerariifolium]